MLKKLLIILLTINAIDLAAKPNLDSLYNVASSSRNIDIAKRVYDLSLRDDNHILMAKSLHLIGWVYRSKNDYLLATEYYIKASQIYFELKEIELLSNTYEDIGVIFSEVLHHKNALRMYKKALLLRKSNGPRKKYAQTTFNIGKAYRQMGEYDSAMYYCKIAISRYLEAGMPRHLLKIYNDMGLVMEMTKSYEIAEEYYMQVLSSAKEENDLFWESRALYNLGAVATKQGQFSEGLRYYNESLSIRLNLDNPRLLMSTYNNIGHAYINQNMFDVAYDYFTKALDHTNHSDQQLLMDSYLQLSKLDEARGHHESALSYSRRYEEVTQKLYALNEELDNQRLFLEGKLVLEELKKHEQAKYDASVRLQWLLITGLLGIVVTGLIIYYYIKARARKRTLELIVQDLTQ